MGIVSGNSICQLPSNLCWISWTLAFASGGVKRRICDTSTPATWFPEPPTNVASALVSLRKRYPASNRRDPVHIWKVFRWEMSCTPGYRKMSSSRRRAGSENAQASSGDDRPGLDNKEQFSRKLEVLALRLPAQQLSKARQAFAPHFFYHSKISAVVPDATNSSMKLILLNATQSQVSELGLPSELQQLAIQYGGIVVPYTIQLNYEHMSCSEVFSKILPPDVEPPSSFETIGHIAHLNLREEHLPYRHQIAQVLLDKNPQLRTIVNKVGVIESEFRVPTLEVLAGDPSLEAEVVQQGCRFRLDYGLAYWNSRLEAEHQDLTERFGAEDVIWDAFAGVGPFAVPAARRGCEVHANDLNPASYKFLLLNSARNRTRAPRPSKENRSNNRTQSKISASTPSEPISPAADSGLNLGGVKEPRQTKAHDVQMNEEEAPSNRPAAVPPAAGGVPTPVQCYNMDAREFLRRLVAAAQGEVGNDCGGVSTAETSPQNAANVTIRANRAAAIAAGRGGGEVRVVMNLPALAPEFMDAFRGVFRRGRWAPGRLPIVHLYAFSRAADPVEDILGRAVAALGCPVVSSPPGAAAAGGVEVREVRLVAPGKRMMRISFRLPPEVLV